MNTFYPGLVSGDELLIRQIQPFQHIDPKFQLSDPDRSGQSYFILVASIMAGFQIQIAYQMIAR